MRAAKLGVQSALLVWRASCPVVASDQAAQCGFASGQFAQAVNQIGQEGGAVGARQFGHERRGLW